MKVLVYRKCSTCMKALKWLDEHNISYEERAIKEENPTYEELKEFVDHCHRCPLCQTRNHSVMGKGNRDPFPEEQEACIPYLKYETAYIKSEDLFCDPPFFF